MVCAASQLTTGWIIIVKSYVTSSPNPRAIELCRDARRIVRPVQKRNAIGPVAYLLPFLNVADEVREGRGRGKRRALRRDAVVRAASLSEIERTILFAWRIASR